MLNALITALSPEAGERGSSAVPFVRGEPYGDDYGS